MAAAMSAVFMPCSVSRPGRSRICCWRAPRPSGISGWSPVGCGAGGADSRSAARSQSVELTARTNLLTAASCSDMGVSGCGHSGGCTIAGRRDRFPVAVRSGGVKDTAAWGQPHVDAGHAGAVVAGRAVAPGRPVGLGHQVVPFLARGACGSRGRVVWRVPGAGRGEGGRRLLVTLAGSCCRGRFAVGGASVRCRHLGGLGADWEREEGGPTASSGRAVASQRLRHLDREVSGGGGAAGHGPYPDLPQGGLVGYHLDAVVRILVTDSRNGTV